MSDKGTISPKEEGAEKRGRGRPRKQPQVKSGCDEPSGSPTPKRPRGRPKGSKNKTVTKGKKAPAASTAGMKRRGRPKKELPGVKSTTPGVCRVLFETTHIPDGTDSSEIRNWQILA
ncbi:uncharacterized protein ACWYII_047942 isoform 1-T3 [Salvelinus alpinus]|uniref:high mobility group protein HMG-I/HMG-Y-like isoform X1 n=1 Tax=Salvelinus sp. IW2-2015 TaxID=2691554 RepID=UPI000CDF7D1C|nr:high mobility group protein HMG-I/HMG-Y-like isoform X1 [Salvelinus alpinus]XP_023861187.1 high mobility group protein HMG-I/HMG-Y-like isoform X1 [Salvelinus alpinus]